jgi:hypothetical protein
MDMTDISKYVRVLDAIMAEHIPRIHNHLRSLDISTDLYIMDWILTLFCKVRRLLPRLSSHHTPNSLSLSLSLCVLRALCCVQALPLDIATRVWDNYFLRGDIFLYATISGVLSYLGPQLESGTFDECLQLLTHLPQVRSRTP